MLVQNQVKSFLFNLCKFLESSFSYYQKNEQTPKNFQAIVE